MNQPAHRADGKQPPLREESSGTLGRKSDDHRDRLQPTIPLRDRLRCRIEASNVLQEGYLTPQERYPDFLQDRLFRLCWLRFFADQLLLAQGRHLETKARDSRRELSLNEPRPATSSTFLAARLAGRHS